jgi:SAM-dependent methyltransferase
VIIGHLGITAEAFDRYINGITFGTLDDFLRSASIDYLSPCDARNLPLDDASVDLVVSNNVIEHIPPETITAIFREFFRVLRRTGKMAHTIDNCDHWAYTDRSISCVNFLRFEDKTWKRLQFNPIDYQNRLRHFEYVDLLADAGFKVTRDISVVEEVLITALKTLPVCSRYRSVPHEKLAVALSRIIAEKK